METQPSSWIDHKVEEILDELTGDADDPEFNLETAWTFIRYAYGMGYTEGLLDRIEE